MVRDFWSFYCSTCISFTIPTFILLKVFGVSPLVKPSVNPYIQVVNGSRLIIHFFLVLLCTALTLSRSRGASPKDYIMLSSQHTRILLQE